jgi:hypothetical protein
MSAYVYSQEISSRNLDIYTSQSDDFSNKVNGSIFCCKAERSVVEFACFLLHPSETFIASEVKHLISLLDLFLGD